MLFIRASSAYVEGSSLFPARSLRAHTLTHAKLAHIAAIFQKINDKSRASYFVPRITTCASSQTPLPDAFEFRYVEMRQMPRTGGLSRHKLQEDSLCAVLFSLRCFLPLSLSAPSEPAYYPVVISSGLLRNL